MGGSSTPQQPTQTTTTAPSAEAGQLFQTAFPLVQQFAANVPSRYPGETVAPLNDLQTAGYQDLITTAKANANPAALTSASLGLQAFPSQQKDFTPVDIRPDLNYNPLTNESIWNPAANPALNAAIKAAQRPVYENYAEQILPNLRGSAITAGGFGGSRQGIAEGISGGKTSQAGADIASKMANEQYANNLAAMMQAYGINTNALTTTNQQNISGENARYATNQDNLLRSIGMAPQIQSAITTAAYAPYLAQMGYGDVLQQQDQATKAAAVQAYNYDQMAPFLQAQEIMSLAQGFPGGTTTATGNVPQANPLVRGIGGALTGAAAGSAFGPVGAGVGAVAGGTLPFLMG
jgi:hypothetical protein